MTTRPENRKTITLLVILIAALAALATSFGIFSTGGPGSYPYESIRGETVQIYGKGLYRHMSADVAIQGIAQDYVTLFIAVPLLVISLIGYRRNSLRSRFLLAGTMGYFWVTFLFYTAMGMYNIMFLCYVALLCFSTFGLIILLLSFDVTRLDRHFTPKTPVKFTGGFLIFNSFTIALLWLSGIVPPLLDGTIYPDSLQHYTTLIVQGFDLGMLLPLAFVSGWLLQRRKPLGYLAGTVYFVFLSILMTALTAKIIAMALNGVNVVPVIFIIPAINGISILCAYSLIKNVLEKIPETGQES
jgi:hypothetical protein